MKHILLMVSVLGALSVGAQTTTSVITHGEFATTIVRTKTPSSSFSSAGANDKTNHYTLDSVDIAITQDIFRLLDEAGKKQAAKDEK